MTDYVSTKNMTFKKKDSCRSDQCKKFMCIYHHGTCGKECVETKYLCNICVNHNDCPIMVVKKYMKNKVLNMVENKVFKGIELDGEKVLEIYVRHEAYQRELMKIRKWLNERKGIDKFKISGLVSEGNKLKIMIKEIRDIMDILEIEYEDIVSLDR